MQISSWHAMGTTTALTICTHLHQQRRETMPRAQTDLDEIPRHELTGTVGGERLPFAIEVNPGQNQCNSDYPRGGYDQNAPQARAASPDAFRGPTPFPGLPMWRGQMPDRYFAPQRYNVPAYQPTIGRSDRRLKRRIE